MKKFLIGILILLVLSGIGAGGYFYYEKNIKNPLSKNKIIKNEIDQIHEVKVKKEEELTEGEKLDILKKRFSLRGTIMKGDSYYDNNQTLLALNEYLKAFKESPNDNQIVKKIALVYFDLKKFSQSFKYYEKVKSSLNDEEKEKMMLSLIYEADLKNKTNIKETSEKIKTLDIPKDEKIYYINSLNCTINLHDCKKIFGDYTTANTGVTFNKLINVKNALDNYENFKSENLYYKDALLIGALFQDKMYNVSNYLGEDLLIKYPSYKPILLTTGKGYYELGKIKEARDFLTKYYELDQSNVNLTYLLGDINFKLRDYVGSNIYYNNALQNGFTPKIDAQRKLIYNYYLLNDKRGMLKMFSFLLDQPEASINDFSLGIYHAILEGKDDDAIEWSQRGLAKFKDMSGFEIFYGYLAWVNRENRNFEAAEQYISDGLQINPRNPLLTLNYGYLEEFKGNYTKALIHFKRTVTVNGEGEFGELALKEVGAIEKFLKENNQTLMNTGNTINSGIVNSENVVNR